MTPVVAFVNNTADRALGNTERQFLGLLRSASGGRDFQVGYYTCPEIARAVRPTSAPGTPYQDIRRLYHTRPDMLIVTGMEPKAGSLSDEPVFENLCRLADWAEACAIPALWSCLAAHAAVLHGDGIGRMRLAQKLSGVFACDVAHASHPLTAGVAAQIVSPHSRLHTLPEVPLRAAGYDILSRSDATGADVFTKHRGAAWLYFQGHPEYDPDTLLLEYRRDVRRHLLGASDIYPAVPQHFFDRRTEEALAAMRRRGRHDIATLQAVLDRAAPMARATWHAAARTLYANWFDGACGDAESGLPTDAMTAADDGALAMMLRR